MGNRRNSLYEVLGVAPDASDADIRTAYERRCEALNTAAPGEVPADRDLQRKVLTLAFRTLASPTERAAYNARMSTPPSVPVPALSLVPMETDPDALALKAEALTLRAEAMSLRAEAMSMRGGRTLAAGGFAADHGHSPLNDTASLLRKVLTVLGTLLAIALVARVLVMLLAGPSKPVAPGMDNDAREKVVLQDYYQTYGVRPANLAEMELMEAERRRKERSTQEARNAERDKARAADAERRAAEDTRRRADEVSARLHAEEQAFKERMRREDELAERDKRAKQERQERAERDESRRARQQEAEWRQVLRSN
ncbi:hypothetical protein [Xylophilus sp. Leaf220]|uniref:hypothetical protein n=1 Tax=Xylophilus sp. Leaf220 TaxID=1735686 RepID=UPI0012E3136C|nr:hypothetical protein [Xylophilus sp. Leaf220]